MRIFIHFVRNNRKYLLKLDFISVIFLCVKTHQAITIKVDFLVGVCLPDKCPFYVELLMIKCNFATLGMLIIKYDMWHTCSYFRIYLFLRLLFMIE